MTHSDYPYVFGPVPSRRLGRSLGIDLVPYKTCSYDCIYCQLGCTTNKTIVRKEWHSLDAIVEQLQQRLKELQAPPDYITLSGSGEPTLFSRIDELIDRVKTITSIPIAILTNGSLFWDKEVRKQVIKADLLVPSLDAGNETLFRHINRPHESISFNQMLKGLIQLRMDFSKPYWLEVFLLAGHSVIHSEIEQIVRCVEMIQPDRIQLNTVIRPPAEEFAYTVPREEMQKIADAFDPPAEVIAEYRGTNTILNSNNLESDILSLLHRRPCTLTDLTQSMDSHPNEVLKYLDTLLFHKKIIVKKIDNKSYFMISD